MPDTSYSGIWVYAEQKNGQINNVTFELLAKAQELKKTNGEQVTAVLIGSNVCELADKLIAYGADNVIVADNKNLEDYSARPYQKVITLLSNKYKPSIILYGATNQGRDLAPRVMVSLKTGLTADAIDVGFDEDGVFYQTTPGYGGKILAHIVILHSRPQMATVRPQIFTPIEPDTSREGNINYEKVSVDSDTSYELLSTEPKHTDGLPLDKAKIIISCGRGVKNEEDLKILKELAELLGAQVAGSRPVIDSGLLSHDYQIGQSGATVKPDLIVNVAVSGSVQYKVGMQNSKTIMSINKAPNAPIFDISNYGVVADYKTIIPSVIEEIKTIKAKKCK